MSTVWRQMHVSRRATRKRSTLPDGRYNHIQAAIPQAVTIAIDPLLREIIGACTPSEYTGVSWATKLHVIEFLRCTSISGSKEASRKTTLLERIGGECVLQLPVQVRRAAVLTKRLKDSIGTERDAEFKYRTQHIVLPKCDTLIRYYPSTDSC
jgi:hypothetical protein